MHLLRKVRGILGTAVAWCLPWAIMGGTLMVGYFIIRRGGIPYESLRMAARVNSILFRVGAEGAAVAGALAGAAFASLLAVRDNRRTFSQLTMARVAAYGALGGAGIGVGVIAWMANVLLRPMSDTFPLVGICAVLGTASATLMLRIARRAKPQAEVLSSSDDNEPVRMAEAVLEVERALVARDNITTLAADGRGAEWVGRGVRE
jgi:hypothetical protein